MSRLPVTACGLALDQLDLRGPEALLHSEQHHYVALLDPGSIVGRERPDVAPAHGGDLDAHAREIDVAQRPADRDDAAGNRDGVQARLIFLALGVVGDAAEKSPEQAVALLPGFA